MDVIRITHHLSPITYHPSPLTYPVRMITYEVTAIVDAALTAQYEQYMTSKHLADVLSTGCFVEAVLERAAAGKYRARYVAQSEGDLERYLRDHTAEKRADFANHFPTGVQLSREVWTELA